MRHTAMTGHLPDCFLSEPWNATTNPQVCICDRLRACEQRVERRIDFMLAKANDYGERTGYIAGVQAARDAVAALANKIEHPWASIGDALAAIDALREEQA